MDDLDDSDLINEDNVDQLRKSWEIEDHWLLRRDFILAHKDKFAFDRLMCLAQLFVNVETLGNEYDIALMKQIRSLEDEVAFVKERRARKKQLDLMNKPKEKPKSESNDWRGEKRKWQDDSYQQYQRGGRGRYDGGYNNNNRQGQGQGYGQTYGQRGARQYSDSRQNYSHYNYNQSNYNQSGYSNNSSYNPNYNNSRNNAWQSSGQSTGQQHYQQHSQQSQPSNRPQYSTSLPGSFNQVSSVAPPQQATYQSNYYNDIPSYSTSSPPHSSSSAEPTDPNNRRSAQSFF